MSEEVVRAIAAAVETNELRSVRARRAAEIVRDAGNYRWVGIYDVDDDEIELVGHTGENPPVFVHFPVTQGLSGVAVSERKTVAAASSTGSEMIVPILGAETGIAIGTLDIESDRTNAFSEEDRAFAERCAIALVPIYE